MYKPLKLLVIFSGLFFAFYIVGRQSIDVFPQIAAFGLEKLWWLGLCYLILMVSVQFALAECWFALLKVNGAKLDRLHAYPTFFLPNLAKYTPGKVLFAIGRVELVRRYGGTRSCGLASFALENIFLIVCAAALSVPVIMNFVFVSDYHVIWVLSVFVVGLVAYVLLLPRIVSVTFKIFRKRLGDNDISIEFTRMNGLIFTSYYFFVWSLYGLSGYLLTWMLFEVGVSELLFVSSAFIAAWLAGFMSVITPGGIGIREGALVILLASLLGTVEAGLLAVIARLIWTISEIGCSTTLLLMSNISKG